MELLFINLHFSSILKLLQQQLSPQESAIYPALIQQCPLRCPSLGNEGGLTLSLLLILELIVMQRHFFKSIDYPFLPIEVICRGMLSCHS